MRETGTPDNARAPAFEAIDAPQKSLVGVWPIGHAGALSLDWF